MKNTKTKKILFSILSVGILSTSLLTIKADAVTATGNGGFARLDKTSRGIRWEVGPKTNWPYLFDGDLEYSNGKIIGISGWGALGSTTSGTEPAYGKGACDVTLTGTATNSKGTAFVVLPGCTLGYYNK